MKKITFNELVNLLCEIDYIDEETYPLVFKVNGEEYQAGIGADFNIECAPSDTHYYVRYI